MSDEAIIEMQDVAVPSRRNPDKSSIEAVNWTVRARDFWIVGGLQGSGKSDLIFTLAGLSKPLGGSYRVYGEEVTGRFDDKFLPTRLRVGMVFHDARLLNHLTIAENVALPARYHHDLHAADAGAWVRELLTATDIMEFASNTPSIVAPQWQRRAGLARALALRPEVLLLENPLRGLDARHTAWWIGFLKRLGQGHDLMRGRATTVIACTDEFRPWRGLEAQFVALDGKKFLITGKNAPEDDATLSKLVVAEGN